MTSLSVMEFWIHNQYWSATCTVGEHNWFQDHNLNSNTQFMTCSDTRDHGNPFFHLHYGINSLPTAEMEEWPDHLPPLSFRSVLGKHSSICQAFSIPFYLWLLHHCSLKAHSELPSLLKTVKVNSMKAWKLHCITVNKQRTWGRVSRIW